MTSSTRSSRRRPAGPLFALLVLTVLSGILGTHALAPSGTPAPEHAMTMAHASATEQASAACSHTDGGSGHLAPADGTCAAAGIGSAYAPPALAALPDALPLPVFRSPRRRRPCRAGRRLTSPNCNSCGYRAARTAPPHALSGRVPRFRLLSSP